MPYEIQKLFRNQNSIRFLELGAVLRQGRLPVHHRARRHLRRAGRRGLPLLADGHRGRNLQPALPRADRLLPLLRRGQLQRQNEAGGKEEAEKRRQQKVRGISLNDRATPFNTIL